MTHEEANELLNVVECLIDNAPSHREYLPDASHSKHVTWPEIWKSYEVLKKEAEVK